MGMNEACPDCGMAMEREPGYFTGAMVFSYGFSVIYYFGMYFLLHGLTRQPLGWIVVESLMLYIPLVPIVFRVSRILWIYLDRSFSPGS
jgi:hypothetical protein